MRINTSRVIGGGLLAGVVMNFVDFLVNGVWLAQRWTDEAAALNPRLVDPSLQGMAMTGWIVTDLLFGLAIVWLYAAIRPRFGPGAGTAIVAAFVVWAISHIAYASFGFLALYSWNVWLLSTLGALVGYMAGAYAGCAIYKEEARTV